MYSLQCTVGVHASSAQAPHWTRATIAVQSSCTVATLQLASTDLAKRGGTVEGVLQPICDPGVKCAACCSPLQRQSFGGKADLFRVLWKRYNPRLESRVCLKPNSMKATAYKNFLQRRSVQIKAKQWTHGTGFEKLWKFGGSLGYRIRYHIQHFLSNSLKRCAGVQMWGGQTRGRKVDAGEEEEQRKGSWAETAANASFIPTVIIFGTYIWNVMSKEHAFITCHMIRMLGWINVVSNWVNDGRSSFKEQL